MKIHVKYECHGPEGRFRLKSYDTAAPPTMCCDRMADEWGGIVDLGLQGFPAIRNVSAVICTAAYPMSDGDIIHAATPISHCPWCGAHIELIDGGLDPSVNTPVAPKLAVEEEGLNF